LRHPRATRAPSSLVSLPALSGRAPLRPLEEFGGLGGGQQLSLPSAAGLHCGHLRSSAASAVVRSSTCPQRHGSNAADTVGNAQLLPEILSLPSAAGLHCGTAP